MKSLREKLIEKLKLFERPDLVRTESGYLADHRPEIAPLAYSIKVNNGLPDHEIDLIIAISRGAHEPTVRELYRNFNGLDFGMSKFTIYGLVVQLDRSDFHNIQNIPYNIETIQTYGRPEYAPELGCIFATSKSEGRKKHFHLIDSEGAILAGEFHENSYVAEVYEELDEWLFAYADWSISA